MEWEKVLAKAKKEGVVAVSTSGGFRLRDALIASFKERYGIGVDMVSGKGVQLALDLQYWLPGQPSWVDKDYMLLNIELSVQGKLAINTSLVRPGDIKSVRDLLNPKWKGKIIINVPTIPGTGAKFVAVVAALHGWDTWREIARQEPIIMRDERLMAEWLVRGKYPIILLGK